MNIPLAKPLVASGDYADQRLYTIEGMDGYWRRLTAKHANDNSATIAVFDLGGLRTAPFRQVAVDVPKDEPKGGE